MFTPVLALALLLATGLVLGLGLSVRAEPAASGLEPPRGLA
jgi:hypothetical protein